jgi:hypothetical protein
MADEFLGKDFQAKTFAFRQPVPFEVSANSAIPWGQAIVNESFESQVIGTGDTGTLSIDIQLPSDYVSLMRSFHLQATDTSAINWVDGVIGLAYQQPGGPYKTSVTAFPEKDYLWFGLARSSTFTVRDRFSTDYKYKFWDVTTRSGVNPGVVPPLKGITNVPLWIPPQSDTNLQSRSVIIYIDNNNASSAANSFVINAVFDLYTLEQAYAAGVMSSPRVF